MDAEVFPATLLAEPGSLVVGRGQVEREGVTTVRSSEKDDGSVAEVLLHAEDVAIEGDGAIVVGDQQVDVPDADGGHSTISLVCSTGAIDV